MQSLLSYPHDINPHTVPAQPPTITPTAVPSGPAQLPIAAPVLVIPKTYPQALDAALMKSH